MDWMDWMNGIGGRIAAHGTAAHPVTDAICVIKAAINVNVEIRCN